jgi:hypothetical protein
MMKILQVYPQPSTGSPLAKFQLLKIRDNAVPAGLSPAQVPTSPATPSSDPELEISLNNN